MRQPQIKDFDKLEPAYARVQSAGASEAGLASIHRAVKRREEDPCQTTKDALARTIADGMPRVLRTVKRLTVKLGAATAREERLKRRDERLGNEVKALQRRIVYLEKRLVDAGISLRWETGEGEE